MVRVALLLRAITVLVAVSAFGGGDGLVQASPSGHAPHGRVTIDGVTVPDMGSAARRRSRPLHQCQLCREDRTGKTTAFRWAAFQE